MLPPEAKTRIHALDLVETALSARGEMSVEYKKRMDRVTDLFSIDKRERTKPLRLATNRQ